VANYWSIAAAMDHGDDDDDDDDSGGKGKWIIGRGNGRSHR
jgi:hypothetical protein